MSDDARQDAVRRLLAQSRADEPLPPGVAARLDTLLGELVQARGERAGVTSRQRQRQRRRRWVGPVLAAAAAAVVVGVAGVSLPPFGGSSDDAGSAADSTASSAPDAPEDRAAEQRPEPGAGQAAPEAATGEAPNATTDRGTGETARGVEQLSSAGFDRTVARLVRAVGTDGLPFLGQSPAGPRCGSGDYGTGLLLPAVYDGTPAVLALRPPAAGVRRVDLLACDSAALLRSTTVPVG